MRLKPRPFMALWGSDRDQNVHALITYHAAQYRFHSFQHLLFRQSKKCEVFRNKKLLLHGAQCHEPLFGDGISI